MNADDFKCPRCGGRITSKPNSIFYDCIAGAPSGDPRGWGCGWFGNPKAKHQTVKQALVKSIEMLSEADQETLIDEGAI